MEAMARTPGLELELVGGLPAHQGHDPVRPGLDLDLRHHRVAHDAGDQADEPVAGRRRDDRSRLGVVAALGDLLGEPGEVDPVDDLARSLGRRTQPAGLAPAPDGVVADAEQLGRLLDPVRRHARTLAACAARCH